MHKSMWIDNACFGVLTPRSLALPHRVGGGVLGSSHSRKTPQQCLFSIRRTQYKQHYQSPHRSQPVREESRSRHGPISFVGRTPPENVVTVL